MWTADHKIEDSYALSTFPLNLKLSAGQQYEWRASDKAPLLVWDPEGKRTVTDAKQLFGNHTFGKSWEHGYQALTTLDKNNNGKVSGDELKPLALWFDANKNGISEPGEVKGVTESGVVNIYVTPDRTDPKTGFIHASKGFDRMVNGKLETLPSVDWFARPYSGAGAAVAAANLSGSGDSSATPASNTIATPMNTPVGTPNWKDRLDAVQAAKKAAGGGGNAGSGGSGGGAGGGSGGGSGGLGVGKTQAQPGESLAIAGAWLWASSPNIPSIENKVGDGILIILDAGDGTIIGSSILELPLEPNAAYADKAIIGTPLRGTFEGKGSSGEEAYRFLVVSTDTGQVTTNTAILSADKKTLKGHSVTKTDRGTLEYDWTAIRMPLPEEK